MQPLVIIPARGGSKGIPDKNIKPLRGTPLINYTIEAAQSVFEWSRICVTTDSEQIKKVAEETGLEVPFLRPPELATDAAGSYGVILHAMQFYADAGLQFDIVILLQPTSPFRSAQQIQEAIALYDDSLDMVVSVKETKANPYFVLFEESEGGYLVKSKPGGFARRQDCPDVYEYNGAIYVMNTHSLLKHPIYEFKKIKKYIMDEYTSIDIDSPVDWAFATFLLEQQVKSQNNE